MGKQANPLSFCHRHVPFAMLESVGSCGRRVIGRRVL